MNKEIVDEAKLDQVDFLAEKRRLVAEKFALQSQLVECNAELKITHPIAKYNAFCRQRVELIKMINERERDLSIVNQRLSESSAVINKGAHSKNLSKHIIRQFVQIRDKWHNYSMEDANNPMARRTAWAVSQEIREVLKAYFDDGKDDSL